MPSAAAAESASADAVVRNALRYTISVNEYAALHRYLLSKSRYLERAAPSVSDIERLSTHPNDHDPEKRALDPLGSEYKARAIRHSIRVFFGSGALMLFYNAVQRRLGRRPITAEDGAGRKQPLYKSPTLRVSLSLSTILLFYRLLFRFFTRLRLHLLAPTAAPFRFRNPHTAALLTSRYAPAAGASMAGAMIAIFPLKQMRASMALYAVFRALEYLWNACERDGIVWGLLNDGTKRKRPWWFGSWIMQPFVFGQLFHAAIMDPDCFPTMYARIITAVTDRFMSFKPDGLPAGLEWPSARHILTSLGTMATQAWPYVKILPSNIATNLPRAYISPTMFPSKQALPLELSSIAPLASRAHPLITSLSCATLHPGNPSCLKTYVKFWLQTFPPIAQVFFVLYSAMSFIPRFKSLSRAPMTLFNAAFLSALKTSSFLTGSLSSLWATLCFFQTWFPKTFLSTQRFFLSGFVAGLFAFFQRNSGHKIFMSLTRSSVDSLWKVGVKRRWWKAMRGGDVWLFITALAISGIVYEHDAHAIPDESWRKGMSWVRGGHWIDFGLPTDADVDVDGMDAGLVDPAVDFDFDGAHLF